MSYRLKSSKIFYGPRAISFANVDRCEALPERITSPDDLDLEAVASDLNHFVFDRGGLIGRAAAKWNFKISGRSPEEAAELTEEFEADGVAVILKPNIVLEGEGVQMIWELENDQRQETKTAPVEPPVKERVRRFRAKLGKSNCCDFQELRKLLQDVYNELDDLDNVDQELQNWAAALDADEEYIAACSGGQVIDDNPF